MVLLRAGVIKKRIAFKGEAYESSLNLKNVDKMYVIWLVKLHFTAKGNRIEDSYQKKLHRFLAEKVFKYFSAIAFFPLVLTLLKLPIKSAENLFKDGFLSKFDLFIYLGKLWLNYLYEPQVLNLF